MSILSVYHVSSPEQPDKMLTHVEDIASTLAEQGVRFEHWQAGSALAADLTDQGLIAAYQQPIDRLMTEYGLRIVDVVRLKSEQPQAAESRIAVLDEHRCSEDQVRLFVAGRGLFSLHIGDHVYAVQCEKGDVVVIPAGTPHWFDAGEFVNLLAIRMFNSEQGRVAVSTGSDIAGKFPLLDD